MYTLDNMPRLHHMLRKVLPFLYERNWYNGQFEFKSDRAIAFSVTVVVVMCIVIVAVWMGSRSNIRARSDVFHAYSQIRALILAGC